MNNRVKGANAEKEYERLLIDRGYLVERVKGSSKFNKSVDFFGIADLICLNSYEIKLVQVKSNSTSGAVKKLTEWYHQNKIYLPQNVSIEVVVRYDNKPLDKRWRIIIIH